MNIVKCKPYKIANNSECSQARDRGVRELETTVGMIKPSDVVNWNPTVLIPFLQIFIFVIFCVIVFCV